MNKNKTQLTDDNLLRLPDNNTQEISPEDVRSQIQDVIDSVPVFKTGGLLFETEVGYAGTFRPTSPEAFATVDMIKGTSEDNPITELYLQSPDLTVWKITIDNSGIIQQESI